MSMEFLNKVKDTLEERQSQYDNPKDNFDKALVMFFTITKIKLTARDYAMLMVCMKLSRESNAHKEDNLLDAVGYIAILNDLHENPSFLDREFAKPITVTRPNETNTK